MRHKGKSGKFVSAERRMVAGLPLDSWAKGNGLQERPQSCLVFMTSVFPGISDPALLGNYRRESLDNHEQA